MRQAKDHKGTRKRRTGAGRAPQRDHTGTRQGPKIPGNTRTYPVFLVFPYELFFEWAYIAGNILVTLIAKTIVITTLYIAQVIEEFF